MLRYVAPAGRQPVLVVSLLSLSFALLTPFPALGAGDTPDGDVAGDTTAEADAADGDSGEDSAAQPADTFLDAVTVSASGSERTLAETPGQVDVIGAEEISTLGHTNVGDLVKYTPGVYVDGDVTRLGTSGFNIRGIGGNRVLTRIDGVPTAEQFDFGPFSVTQYALDVDALERAEIVRSAGSALYGSNALGGVVSLETRGPRSYLAGDSQHLSLRGGYDGRADELSETLVYAYGTDRWQGSVLFGRRDGEQLDNQGEIASDDFTRTRPNPIDRRQNNLLAKVNHSASGSELQGTLEWFDGRSETEVLSARAPASPFADEVLDSDAVDTQERLRLSVRQTLVRDTVLLDSLLWRGYWQAADTEQKVTEVRLPSEQLADRFGILTFDQDTYGFDVEARKGFGERQTNLLTYGLALRRDTFDQLRDRTDTFRDTGEPVPTTLALPSKYFPESEVDELGAFVQAEIDLWQGRLRLVPGVRFDRYSLDANENDRVFLEGNPGTPPPADLTDQAFSPKLGMIVDLTDELSAFAQYARGFRAPPMSSVNNGFTNRAGGYRTLANPDLEPETSDNLEVGIRGSYRRGSFSAVAFDNRYDDFIELLTLGFNPQEGLIEFQPQNVNEVRIEGFELSGELRFGSRWLLRGAYSRTEGENRTAGEPLESIAPHTLVAGLRYGADRWGSELTVTAVEDKTADDLPTDSTQFQTPAYETIDVAAWLRLTDRFSLQATGWNLTDETYWIWANARGQAEGSATLDRYTSPGRSFGAQLRFQF